MNNNMNNNINNNVNNRNYYNHYNFNRHPSQGFRNNLVNKNMNYPQHNSNINNMNNQKQNFNSVNQDPLVQQLCRISRNSWQNPIHLATPEPLSHSIQVHAQDPDLIHQEEDPLQRFRYDALQNIDLSHSVFQAALFLYCSPLPNALLYNHSLLSMPL